MWKHVNLLFHNYVVFFHVVVMGFEINSNPILYFSYLMSSVQGQCHYNSVRTTYLLPSKPQDSNETNINERCFDSRLNYYVVHTLQHNIEPSCHARLMVPTNL
jgi:hypothetical protein